MKTNSSIPAVLEAAKAASGHLQYRNMMLQSQAKSAASATKPPQGQPNAKSASSK